MAAPVLNLAVVPTTYKYPPKVVELREHADSIANKITDLKSKRDPIPGQISAIASSIADAVESACAGRGLEVLEPFAAVAVEEIDTLLSSCCAALDSAYPKKRFGAKLIAFASRATSRSPSPSPSPAESTSLDDYRVSLEAVKVLLRIENDQSMLVYSGTMFPVATQNPALLQKKISTSTVINEVVKTALQAMSNATVGLRPPYKAVAGTILQFYEHVESYRKINGSITAIVTKIEDFVKIVERTGGRQIGSGEKAAEAIEVFFRAVQSIVVRLEILKATRRVKRFAAPAAVAAAVAEGEKNLDHAQKLLNTSLQLHIHNAVHEIRGAQILAERSGDVIYTAELPACPKILHGRDEELRSLVDFVIDRSRPIRVAIVGAGGLGKTTLAKAVVHHIDVAHAFADHRFFVSAEAAAGVDKLLAGMLNIFGLSATSDPLKSLLHYLRSNDTTLLVLDNLETIWNSANAAQRRMTEDVLSQLDSVTSLTLVITCRGSDLPPYIDWENRTAVVLTTLSPEAAVATFTDIAGDVCASDYPVRDALLKEVDYMPLAVTLLARLVAKKEELRDLATRWKSSHTSILSTKPNGRLDNVDASIQLSIAYLPPNDPAPLQLLSLCAQLPDGMRLPVRKELERLCGFRDLDGALDVIQGLALVYVTDDDTIRMLSPIRLYVLEKHRPQADHRACLLRIYYEIASQAPQNIDTQFPAARDKILPELSNLDGLLMSEIENFDEPPSTDLIDAVNAVSDFSCHNVPTERLLMALIPRIEHLLNYLADSLSILAEIHWLRDAYDLSLDAATRARSLYQSLGQHSAGCDMAMAKVHRTKGNYPKAIASLSAARETFNDLDRELDVAYCDRDLALVLYEQKNFDDATALFTSAREVFLRLDVPSAAAFCQELLGDIHRLLGDYQAAETQLESALQTYTSLGSMGNIASCSCSLGEVYRFQRRFDAALERLQVAYDIGQKQGETSRIADALRFRSYVHRDQGQLAQARRLLLDVQRLYESVEYTRGVGLCAKAFDELDRAEQA